MEEDLLEQSCQRKEQECVSLSENESSYKSVHMCETGTQTLFF